MYVEREEGSLLLDGAPTRRWVSIIAVVIPVGAFVLLAALFIRTYVVPPTYGIPSPTTTAEAPPAPNAAPRRVAVETVRSDQAMSAPAANLPMLATLAVAPPSVATTAPTNSGPAQNVATVAPALSAAPAPPAAVTASVAPMPPTMPAPTAAPAQVASIALPPPPVAETTGSRREMPMPSIIAAEPAAATEDAAAPISSAVPLPRAKPPHHAMVASRAVPLPRPRPVEEAPESDLPAIDRHAAVN